MNKPKVFDFNTHDLPRRAGEMREYSLTIVAPERIGIDVIGVSQGEEITIDFRLEAVTQGVLVTAQVTTQAQGECIRCLDPLELAVRRSFQELYRYEPEKAHTKAQRKAAREIQDDLDEDEELMMEGEVIDLEEPVRDAIILGLPINPLCDQECQGLCPGCGIKWSLLESGHAHEEIDARWADLSALLQEPEEKRE